MPNHTSKSGPVKVIARFEPLPTTPAQERQRLQHKLVLLENRIAEREAFTRRSPYTRKGYTSPNQLKSLIEQRDALLSLLSEATE